MYQVQVIFFSMDLTPAQRKAEREALVKEVHSKLPEAWRAILTEKKAIIIHPDGEVSVPK